MLILAQWAWGGAHISAFLQPPETLTLAGEPASEWKPRPVKHPRDLDGGSAGASFIIHFSHRGAEDSTGRYAGRRL